MAIRNFRSLNPAFVPQADWKQQYFSAILENSALFLRWIQQDDKTAGFILFGVENHRFLPRKSGVIYELYIEPEFRKRGLAREAAMQAVQVLRHQSVSKIQLDVVKDNTAAKFFWESLGFQKTSERYVFAGDLR